MKLTTVEFRDFIHTYNSLPTQVLESYGFTQNELPTDERKRGFHQMSKWYKAYGIWLRHLLLLENEYVIELKSASLKDYRVFGHEKKQFYELIRAIFLSKQIGESYPNLIETSNCNGLFYLAEWHICETGLIDMGILGNKPKPLPSKTGHYEIAKFFHEYSDDPKTSRIFQKDDTGQLVNASSLENSALNTRKFILQDSIEPQQGLDCEARNIIEFILMLGQTPEFCITEALSAYTRACARRARTVSGDAKFGTFVVNKDGSLEYSRSKKTRL